ALVGAQDQFAELGLLLQQRLLALLDRQPSADVEVGLALVAAKVEQFEGAERFVCSLQLALYADQALAGGVDCKLTEIGGYPPATELLGDGGSCASPGKKICDKIALVAASQNHAFYQRLRLLRGVAHVFWVGA